MRRFIPSRGTRSGVAESTHRRNRRRGVLLLLCSLCLLAQPVVGNGPGPDPQTVYTGESIDLETEAAEGELALHPGVNGDFIVTGTVRMAADGTFERPVENVSGNLRALTDAEFYWDSNGAQYYAVDAAVANGTFRLRAEPVRARRVVEDLSIAVANVSGPVARAARSEDHRVAVDDDRTAPIDRNPTLVATGEEYVFVTRSLEPARDPYRAAKLALYAFAGSGMVTGALLPVLTKRRRD